MTISRQGMGQAALLLIAGAILSRIFGLIRETVIAYQFGAAAQTDAFLVASIIPTALIGIVASAITVAFIPVFIEHRLKDGEEDAWIIASAAINITALALTATAVLFILAVPVIIPLLAPGFSPETKSLAIHLSILLSPVLIFNGMVGLATALLNTYRHFTYPAFVGILYNLGMIGGSLVLGDIIGITGLVVGVVFGAAVQLLTLIIPIARQKTSYKFTLKGLSHPGVKKIGLMVFPFLVASAAGQINLLVDRILASGLAEGSISALNFAVRVMQLPIGIFVGAAATAAYPFLAEQAAGQHVEDMRRTFSEGLRVLWFIVFPLSVGLMVLSEPIVRLLFERGAFDTTATRMTAIALTYYAIGIFAHAAHALLVRLYFAFQDTVTPVKLGFWAIGLNIILNFILVRYLAHGGLALATSITAIFNCILLTYYLRRRLGHLDGRRILCAAGKIVSSSVIMGILVAVAHEYTLLCFNPDIFIHRLLQVSGLIALGGAIYIVAAIFLKTEELSKVIGYVRIKLNFYL